MMSPTQHWVAVHYGFFADSGDPGRPAIVFDIHRFNRHLQSGGGYPELKQWVAADCDPPVFFHSGFTWVYAPGPVPDLDGLEP